MFVLECYINFNINTRICYIILIQYTEMIENRKKFSLYEVCSKSIRPFSLSPFPLEFMKCFEKWQKRWDKCVNHQGEYFEGD